MMYFGRDFELTTGKVTDSGQTRRVGKGGVERAEGLVHARRLREFFEYGTDEKRAENGRH